MTRTKGSKNRVKDPAVLTERAELIRAAVKVVCEKRKLEEAIIVEEKSKVKLEGWVNVYKHPKDDRQYWLGSDIYPTQEAAKSVGSAMSNKAIKQIYIEVEV